jgi:hypothetical protein
MMSSIHILKSTQQERSPDTIHQSITGSSGRIKMNDRLLVEMRFG